MMDDDIDPLEEFLTAIDCAENTQLLQEAKAFLMQSIPQQAVQSIA